MLSQYSNERKKKRKKVNKGKTSVFENTYVDLDESELDACPYVDPSYNGPYSSLDDYPDLVKKIQTQTLHPEFIIKKFREGLDTSILDLRALKLSADNVGNIIMPFLTRNPQITELRIYGNNIGDEGVTLLATNQTLKKLDASLNNITDIGVVTLCQNKNIACLYIESNRLTEKGIEVLANNSALAELRISLSQFHKNIDIKALNFFLKNDTLKVFRCSEVHAGVLDSFWKELIQQRALRSRHRKTAFLMGCHPRLGESSPILTLYKKGGKEMISEILSYVKSEPFKLTDFN